jgi:hypothetical protein
LASHGIGGSWRGGWLGAVAEVKLAVSALQKTPFANGRKKANGGRAKCINPNQ